jgi:aminoglycoside 3-N-acetyltransferase
VLLAGCHFGLMCNTLSPPYIHQRADDLIPEINYASIEILWPPLNRMTTPMSHPSLAHRDLVPGLKQLGVSPGAIVEVHSSLSSFGWVADGATTVIDALLQVVGTSGTIIMSAYPVSPAIPLTDEDRALGITWKVRKLPFDSPEPTGMGRISDTFRQRPDVICGHSFFRTCAWGRDAAWHTNGYHGLLAVDGWCLLLGVGIDRCSSMHAAEDSPLPNEISRCWAIPEHVQAVYDPAEWSIGYGGTPDDAWQMVWQKADQRGLVRHQQIGQARCSLFKARSVVSIYKQLRQTDPYRLYGVVPGARAE